MVENTEEMHEKVVLRMDVLYLWSLSTNNRPLPRLPFASHFARSAEDREWWAIVEFISKPSRRPQKPSRVPAAMLRRSAAPARRQPHETRDRHANKLYCCGRSTRMRPA